MQNFNVLLTTPCFLSSSMSIKPAVTAVVTNCLTIFFFFFTIFGYSRVEMASHSLVAVVILMSCIIPSTCSNDSAKTYSARVLNTIEGECPSDAQREATIAEVQEDIRNLLNSRK